MGLLTGATRRRWKVKVGETGRLGGKGEGRRGGRERSWKREVGKVTGVGMKLRCIVKVWRLAGGRSKIVKEDANGDTWGGSHDRHIGRGEATPPPIRTPTAVQSFDYTVCWRCW